ncbi:hypothetical protein [Chenggangzhangella methanolivorans]|uniref:Uncharacterized protein n=1 Tax=Chenggangzhangella methanolivorans TaxID=1437009 RepID=A0A9E6R6K0_9HYPH|nr:hypothetical protein [Chenggangzhangella methanolivorans]QZN99185.1 hypothetical protein K6K41_20485 [Chenggangzhangella methanolivorans]
MAASILGPQAASAQTVKQPVVVDDNGKALGPLVGVNSVLLSYQSVTFLAPFTRFGFKIDEDKNFSGLSQDTTIYYFSNDCSGDEYLKAGPVPAVAALKSNRFLFPDAAYTHNMSQSRRKGPNAACKTETEFGDFGLLQSKSVASFGFKPPFRVELR